MNADGPVASLKEWTLHVLTEIFMFKILQLEPVTMNILPPAGRNGDETLLSWLQHCGWPVAQTKSCSPAPAVPPLLQTKKQLSVLLKQYVKTPVMEEWHVEHF